jgi:hypothetical protein
MHETHQRLDRFACCERYDFANRRQDRGEPRFDVWLANGGTLPEG